MKKILILFGTRPEAIKLAPVIQELIKQKRFKTIVCSTGQHREMLNQVLELFQIKVDYDLDLMKPNQDLFDITINSTEKLKRIFRELKPDLLIVQGDTTTAFISALSAFYSKVKIGHIEAGLRSYNIFSPYPEEANRRFISTITDLHFAPTEGARNNLIKEGISKNHIWVTGNTVIDALFKIKKLLNNPDTKIRTEKRLSEIVPDNFFNKKFILITMHRREKFGEELENILLMLKNLAKQYDDLNFIYPVHLNPNVLKPAREILHNIKNLFLIQPLDYLNFIYLMSRCYFILSDSGGIQEECFVFQKPIIVMRDVTERNEAIEAGYAFLAGNDLTNIKNKFSMIYKKLQKGENLFNTSNPFGNGTASKRIVRILKNYFYPKS